MDYSCDPVAHPILTFESAERTLIHETNQFDRWGRMFTPQDGAKYRKKGSNNDFTSFFEQMMPIGFHYTLIQQKDNTFVLSVIDEGRKVVHTSKGNLKANFVSLLRHYGEYRGKYFEERYNVKWPKKPLDRALSRGLNPPEQVPPKEVIKEVVKEVKVEVPIEVPVPASGKSNDRLETELNQIYNALLKLSGSKKLPNRFRKMETLNVRYHQEGRVEVDLVLGP